MKFFLLASLCSLFLWHYSIATTLTKTIPSSPNSSAARLIPSSKITTQSIGVKEWLVEELAGERTKVIGKNEQNEIIVDFFIAQKSQDFAKPIIYVTKPLTTTLFIESTPKLTGDATINLILNAVERDLAAASIEKNHSNSTVQTFDLQTYQAASYMKKELTCMARLAQLTYEDDGPLIDNQSACSVIDSMTYQTHYVYQANLSTNVMKVFTRTILRDNVKELNLVLAWRGSKSIGDFARDLQSMQWTEYETTLPYFNAYPSEQSAVGEGFIIRVNNQHNDSFDILRTYILKNKPASNRVRILHTGHSLGGVAATIAGYMWRQNNSLANISTIVEVTAFNPPKLGNAKMKDSYMEVLMNTEQYNNNGFILRQLTRYGDPIHLVPLFHDHPFWNIQNTIDSWTSKNSTNCGQFHAPRASLWNLYANHSLDRWIEVDIAAISDAYLECMGRYQ